MWRVHVTLCVTAVIWISHSTYTNTAEIPYPPWAVYTWITAFILFLFAPRQPAIGLLIYGVLATLVGRYQPGVPVAFNLDILMYAALLCLTAATVHVLCHGQRPRLPSADSWVTWAFLALILWVGLATLASMRLVPWGPSPYHHPRQYIVSLALFLLASQYLGGRRVATALALILPLSIGIRGRCLSPYGIWRLEDMASLLVITLPLTLAPVMVVRGIKARVAIGVFCVLLIVNNLMLLNATDNRAAIVALLAVIFALWLVSRWRFVLLLLGLPPLAFAAYKFTQTQYWDRFELLWTQGGDTSGSGRTELWRGAWMMIRDHPLLGIGPGNFPAMLPTYIPNPTHKSGAHNILLGMAADNGIPALLLFLVVFLGALFYLWQTIRFASTDWPAPVARLLLASIVGYLAVGMFITRHDMILAYFLAGWAVALRGQLMGRDILPDQTLSDIAQSRISTQADAK